MFITLKGFKGLQREWLKDSTTYLTFNVCNVLNYVLLKNEDGRLAYGIFHGRYDLQQDILFTLPSCSNLRGHDLKLRHHFFHLAR